VALWPQAGAALALLAALVAACDAEGTGGSEADGGAVAGEVLVSAASSLTDAFEDIESAFEAAHPGVDVVLNLGSSSTLAVQILEGAPVDVFASANPANMERVRAAGQVRGAAAVFARNRLQIAVPAGNPAAITGLADFANESLRLGLCAETVPCGIFARQALERAGVAPELDTNEADVRALLNKIELGELDAGITYVTDVASARGAVQGIDIPEEYNVVAEYPIAVLAGAPNPRGAEAFVRFVLSEEGRRILAAHGFAP
jgi:molybdate transport system substrate-binding protein